MPKIRMFWWRMVVGALAVADRLQSRGIVLDTECKLCNQTAETTCHGLFGCPIARLQYEMAQVPLSASGFSNSLEENVSYLLDLLENASTLEITRISIPWIPWCIWKNRNKVLYAGTQDVLEVVVNRAIEEATIWHKMNVTEGELLPSSMMNTKFKEKWQPPLSGTVKCNINANWRNAQLHCGGAWLIRDCSGSVLHHAREAFTRSDNRIYAELRCVVWAMQSIRDLHYSDAIIASDSAAVIEAITKPHVWPLYASILRRIKEFSLFFDNVMFEEEHPGANMVAKRFHEA